MSKTFEILHGYATPDGTKNYANNAIQKRGKPSSHFRLFDGLYLSSVGIGTYLGNTTKEDDEALENAIYKSVSSGAINVIDTAINYRAMKSERSIGRALNSLINDGIISRDQVFICTKNGYITNDGDYPAIDVMEYLQRMYISTGIIKPDDISSGYNVLNPAYIERCIDKSLTNMHLGTIDLVYVHNALESWYEDVSREEFIQMLTKVFEIYERYRSNNKIRYYGMATWTCFRVTPDNKEYLSLEEVVKLAEKIGGNEHGFRFIQLPYNLAYSEALVLKNQTVGAEKNLNILEAAARLRIGIFTSIPLFQGQLLRASIPDYGGSGDQVAKLIQIIRSSPSIIAPLIGQKKREHVEQNLRVSDIPPMSKEQFEKSCAILFKKS
ncbi:aldo/keto reductase [Nitrososphaera sp. AFS]|jgi:aryl-alcohol dehydrogenase-like predicted oxidoreductase|uniref:aldo/keto reductase n=1 Tax=Nitrososphaera sp. AFS TaxID=2301191 RepID=UPI0013922F56|nr:aldo/keto reductase [Nitrososphaera sp. AFS]